MKNNVLVLCMFCFLFMGCSTGQLADGWYFITDSKANAVDRSPIVTASDFAALLLDSFPDAGHGTVSYQVIGKIKDNKVKAWADATEKAIGKQIGFMYNGEIISAPQVNMRIESGNFSISSKELLHDRQKMTEIFEQLKKKMN